MIITQILYARNHKTDLWKQCDIKISTRSSPIAPQSDTNGTHFSSRKTLILSLLELPVEDYAHFYMPGTKGPTELLKNAKNRFQIGLVFPGKRHKCQNLVCIAKMSCLFEMHFNKKIF